MVIFFLLSHLSIRLCCAESLRDEAAMFPTALSAGDPRTRLRSLFSVQFFVTFHSFSLFLYILRVGWKFQGSLANFPMTLVSGSFSSI
ncbi:hypothetical protein BX600DRAFT_474733 [Xylariales sp. PMI_506]|nr:hypothetical protein BX600DRAFT_474733 [Xylariales sp. PMI_506]